MLGNPDTWRTTSFVKHLSNLNAASRNILIFFPELIGKVREKKVVWYMYLITKDLISQDLYTKYVAWCKNTIVYRTVQT